MTATRRISLFVEALLGHWFVVAIALLNGLGPLLLVALAWTLTNAIATVRVESRTSAESFAHAPSPSARLRRYVTSQRILIFVSQIAPTWIAIGVAPRATLVMGFVAVVSLGVVRVRPSWKRALPPSRVLALVYLTTLVIDGGFYFGIPSRDCAGVTANPHVTPVVTFHSRPESPPGMVDPRDERDCLGPRTIAVDPADGALLIACGIDPPGEEQHALIRILPDHPEAKRIVVDRASYQVLVIPEANRVALSVFGRDVVRLFDRETLAPLGEVPLRRPLPMTYDAAARRILVGAETGEQSCLFALDASAIRQLDPHAAPSEVALAGTAARVHGLEPLHEETGRDCRPSDCSPASVLALPELGRVLVSNYMGPCTLHAHTYRGLEMVAAREWLFPGRGLMALASGHEVLLARPFLSRVDRIDAAGLARSRAYHAGFGVAALARLDDHTVAVGNYVDGSVRALDTASGALHGQVFVGAKLRDLATDAARRRLYAVSSCGVYGISLDAFSPSNTTLAPHTAPVAP